MEHPLLKLLSETDNSSVLYQEIVILYLKDELIDVDVSENFFNLINELKFYLCKYDGNNVLDYFTNNILYNRRSDEEVIPITTLNKKYLFTTRYNIIYFIKKD